MPVISALLFPNTEHLGAAHRADTLSGWLAILHGYGFRVLHFPFGATLHAVCLHQVTSSFFSYRQNRTFLHECQ